MTANPKPKHPLGYLNTQGAIVATHPDREITPDTLEVQRGMRRALLEQREALVGEFTHRWEQGVVTRPKS
jgi:hypothetical protein